jgi:hypothetical protein
MKKFIFVPVLVLSLFQGCSPTTASETTPKPGWTVYSNAVYGYEIQYPEGYILWPTGPEDERDGASIRIALRDRQAPVPVLDIRVSPRTPETEFPNPYNPSADMTAESAKVMIGGIQADELILRWKAGGEIAFVELHLRGVLFQFAAGAGMPDFHTSEWWNIISTFRLTAG